MIKDRILVVVKTYPTLSRKYGETVCTAGIRGDGSWVRIYPVPFRRLDESEQYKKFDWLDCVLIKNSEDPRPESFRPADINQLLPVGNVNTDNNWQERRRLILNTASVYTKMQSVIDGAKANRFSLAIFKPTRILDFIWETEDREWDQSKVEEMRDRTKQGVLFGEDAWRQTFRIIAKLPYSFSYRFEDDEGRVSELQVLDWEAGQLFWSCMRKNGHGEQNALKLIKAKYIDEFTKKDLHFFLGTTQQFHGWAINPWVIVGVFPIPHQIQEQLF